MNCQEASKRISSFINGNLKRGELKDFIRHLESCPDCYEETDVLYMMREADLAFQDPDARNFDFSHALKDRLSAIRKAFRAQYRYLSVAFLMLLILLILSVFDIILYIAR